MRSLSEQAEAFSSPKGQPRPPSGGGGGSKGDGSAHRSTEVELSGFELGEGDPEMIPVNLAWLRVRREIGAIAKGETYNAAGTRYNFRGVDTVVKVFGPVTIKHGVSVLPVHIAAEHNDATSSGGKKMRECTVTVTWRIVGPLGDWMEVQSAGEALDSADKGTAKAQSVALRVLLLSAGLTPTDDPDPDTSHIDRGEAPLRSLTDYLAEICNTATSAGRLRQIHAELKQSNRLSNLVVNELDDEEGIGAMIVRIGQERKAAEAAAQS